MSLCSPGSHPCRPAASCVPACLQRRTALHLAAYAGHLEGVKALLAAGAQPGAAAQDDMNALHFAALKGHAPVIKWLLNEGGRPAARGVAAPVCLTTAAALAARSQPAGAPASQRARQPAVASPTCAVTLDPSPPSPTLQASRLMLSCGRARTRCTWRPARVRVHAAHTAALGRPAAHAAACPLGPAS